jgi:hypothetical protein
MSLARWPNTLAALEAIRGSDDQAIRRSGDQAIILNAVVAA